MREGKSFIRIKVTGMKEAIYSALLLQSLPIRKKAITHGALDAMQVIKNYYASKGRPLWVNNALPTHGAGRQRTQWWRATEYAWFLKSRDTKSAIIENSTIGLSHKITGGTIRAKRRKFLTIPIDPRAHGITAKQFSRSISPLFRVKNILAYADDDGATKTFKPAYVLKKSVTQKPWLGALPPEQGYIDAFARGVIDSLIDEINKA